MQPDAVNAGPSSCAPRIRKERRNPQLGFFFFFQIVFYNYVAGDVPAVSGDGFFGIKTLDSYVFVLSNSRCAGHPISLCLQYLHAIFPRTSAFPANPRMKRAITRKRRIQLNSVMRSANPTTRGMKNTRKSGMMSFLVICRRLKCSGVPLGKNIQLNRPFAKAQVLP